MYIILLHRTLGTSISLINKTIPNKYIAYSIKILFSKSEKGSSNVFVWDGPTLVIVNEVTYVLKKMITLNEHLYMYITHTFVPN